MLIVNGKQVVCTYFYNEQKKVSKILDKLIQRMRCLQSTGYVCVMCFFKNSAFYNIYIKKLPGIGMWYKV